MQRKVAEDMTEADVFEPTESEWYPYEGGATINQVGGNGGFVLRDEELGDPEDPEGADARLTLEQGRADNPGFFVTAALYGWMLHTVRRDTAEEASSLYNELHAELTRLAGLLPYEEDGNKRIEAKTRLLNEAITILESRFV